jgi:hypothetical protein
MSSIQERWIIWTRIAEQNSLVLTEPIDFVYEDKVVHYDVTGLDYTFIFFALKKSKSL